MSKGKKIYFLVLLLITILVTTFYFSYAIFSNTQEEHGKLNIVAGTLNYKIESSELDSDSITLEANTSKEIKIKLTSLNEVSSKYELYYILDKTNDKVSVGYSKDTKDNVLGTIDGSSSKMISIVVRNDSDTTTKVTFKVLGGLVNNELALKDGNSLNKEVSLYCPSDINIICISTTEELRQLATEVNNGDNKSGKTYYLINDLDLGGKFDENGNSLDGNISWTPIGTETNPFSGIFDGRGHVISNMYINTDSSNNGLFGNAKDSTISNVGVLNSFVKGNFQQAGVVGCGNNSQINNVYNKATVKGNTRTAGICGAGCTVKNCYNGGDITNNNQDLTGGIVGGWGTVINSYNYGTIASNGGSVGGIVGWTSNVYNSVNYGNINTDATTTGGILGSSPSSTIQNTYNFGNIPPRGGGIVGNQYDCNSISCFNLNLKNNYYLKGTASYGITLYKSDVNASPLEKDKMPSVLSVINGDDAFVEDTTNINNGYPILKWQLK